MAKPAVVIVTEGGLVQSVISNIDIQVLELGYDKDEIADKETELPTRVSLSPAGDKCVLYDWSGPSDDKGKQAVAWAQKEYTRQQGLHEFLRDDEENAA